MAEGGEKQSLNLFKNADEDDDPVVHEMDVFLSKSNDDLYVLQYPTRPSHFNKLKPVRSRIKPIHQQVELEFDLDTECNNYDTFKGDKFVKNIDEKDEDKYFNSDLMDKVIFRSVKAVPNPSRYAVGYLKDGQLHITPIKSIIQMKPSFEYLDKSDVKQRKENKENDGDESDDEKVTQQITVKFANPDKDKVKRITDRSFHAHQQALDEEPWTYVTLNPINSEESEMELERLVCKVTDSLGSESRTEPKDYVKALMSQDTDNDGFQTPLSSDAPLIRIRALPLGDQIHSLLMSAKVMDFERLLRLLSPGVDSAIVLRLVQEVALLVQGCWVIKSDRLYPKEMRSSNSGVGSEILTRGRDYIMWSFTQSRFVNRKEIANKTKLPPDDLKEILEQFSQRHALKGWEFLLPTDTVFIAKYSQVVDRQQKLWELRSKQLQNLLTPTKESNTEKKSPDVRSPRQRRRTKSQRDSESDKEVFTEAEPRIKSEPVENGNGLMEECKNQCEPTPEMLQELNSFVREKLTIHCCLTLSDLRRLLNQKLVASPPGYILGRGISDKLLSKAVEDSGGSLLNVKWCSENRQESLFALTAKGDTFDGWRTVLFEMYKTNTKFRKKTIQKRIEDETKQNVSDCDLGDLLRDYCINVKGMFYLKGTCQTAT